MKKKSVSPLFRGIFIAVGMFVLNLVIGGVNVLAAGSASADASPGFFQHYFVQPFTMLLEAVANMFQGNFGLSIIFVTLIIRLLLLPLMMKSTKSQMHVSEKMKVIQPEMKAIQDKLKNAKDNDEKMKIQQEMMALYQKHDFNPMASMSGCLPMLIQMPILMGFYYAIRGSEIISAKTFLWFDLGSPDLILMILAVGVYFLQSKVSMANMTPEQKKQMSFMLYLSPMMIGIISFSAPAALPLYWIVSGSFLLIQTIVLRKMYSPKPNPEVVKS